MAKKVKDYFGVELAELLSQKIGEIYPQFKRMEFVNSVSRDVEDQEYSGRVKVIAHALRAHLPNGYPKAIKLLVKIMGPPNPNETGMFSEYYWLTPVGKFIEEFGLDFHKESLDAIEELTQRNTGEYAIRPWIVARPKETLERMTLWADSESFHLRRLASEGLRPRLPWAKKLDLFIHNPAPVFGILEKLKADPSRFVQKSVANNLNDYLKVNPQSAYGLLQQWSIQPPPSTRWIIRHALRVELKRGIPQAAQILANCP